MRHIRHKQGSPEWLAHRKTTRNASDAAAVLDCSPYKKRSELVRELATGIGQEFSPEQQAILNSGHVFEALARPLAEEIVGEEFYPVVGVHDDGVYGASYDGLTMLEDTAFEHKRLNAALRDAMVEGCTGADLPLHYQVQMEQQCLVNESIERILFMASEWRMNGDAGKWELIEERHCWYTPNLELRARVFTGWALLEKDVAAYTPPKAEATVDKVHAALPVLRIEASGEITASNLDEFKVVVLDRINTVSMELVTDQNFADGAADAEWLRDVSAKMKEAVQRVRGGMQTVDEVLRVLEQLDDIATKKAIAIEKLVKSEKDARKEKIVLDGDKALAAHVTALNDKLGASYITSPRGLFAPIVKGLKSLASMEDKVKVALAGAMADADGTAARLAANRKHLQQADQDWITLFPDFATVGTKAAEDFQALAALRIGNHRTAEAKRLETERERIRQEEQQRADAEMREKLILTEAQAQAGIAEARSADELPGPLLDDLSSLAKGLRDSGVAEIDTRHAIATAQTSAAAVDTGQTMTLGQINALIAPIKVDAAGLAELGFVATTIKAAKHYPTGSVPHILSAMVKHLQGVIATA
ncbi:YqaJ viral recombinase family protein [Comamonas sp. UBA7528]|uniref:YqaJ viral recombinase family protein n=1 Tax=Comamonas sp. UBA7528 TaxID=1946391 RepID=UPI0025BE25B2|nr:YqaJ viral recombinase family protein [Comamonas sp. UBA7528]